jgi:ribose transport system permease protein
MSVAMIIYGILNFLAWLASKAPPPPHPIPDFGGLANTPVFRIYSTNSAGARTVVFPGISWIVIIMVLVAVFFHFVSTKTRIGRYFRMVGSSQVAARFSGIKVKRFACVLAGMLAGLSGEVGSIGGTVIGSFIISTLATGLSMMNTNNPALPMLFNGVVVLAAVCLDQVRNRRFAGLHPESGPDL